MLSQFWHCHYTSYLLLQKVHILNINYAFEFIGEMWLILEVELWHLEGRQVSRSVQSLMTSISRPEGQVNLKIGGTHRLMIINQHIKCHQNWRRSCKFLIDLIWNVQKLIFHIAVSNQLIMKNFMYLVICFLQWSWMDYNWLLDS